MLMPMPVVAMPILNPDMEIITDMEDTEDTDMAKGQLSLTPTHNTEDPRSTIPPGGDNLPVSLPHFLAGK